MEGNVELDMKIDDPLFGTVNQEVFEVCLRDYFAESCTTSSTAELEVIDVELTADEMNVIMLVAMCLAHCLKSMRKRKVNYSCILNSLFV